MVPFSEKDLLAVNEKVQLEALKGFYGRWEDLVELDKLKLIPANCQLLSTLVSHQTCNDYVFWSILFILRFLLKRSLYSFSYKRSNAKIFLPFQTLISGQKR